MNITALVMIAVGSCGAAICLDGLLKRIKFQACSDDARCPATLTPTDGTKQSFPMDDNPNGAVQ
jgi:hypothetical protein